MEYQIARTDSLNKLEYTVNQLISVGWKPLGGVCAIYSQIDKGSGHKRTVEIYCQALIKEQRQE